MKSRENALGITKEDLKRKRFQENKTINTIAQDYGCSFGNITYYLKQFGLRFEDVFDENEKYQCNICNQFFSNKKGLIHHKIRHPNLLIDKKNITKEKLISLYRDKLFSINAIAKCYEVSDQTINHLFERWKIKKIKKEKKKLYQCDICGRFFKTLHSLRGHNFQKKDHKQSKRLERITKIKREKIDKISQAEACKLLSCDLGLERLKIICLKSESLDFKILSEIYKNIEKIFFKKNKYPSINIKCALTLYLKYDLSQEVASILCKCSIPSLAKYFSIIINYIKPKKLHYEPDIIFNLSILFSEKYLMEIKCPICSKIYTISIKKRELYSSFNPECPYCKRFANPTYRDLDKIYYQMKAFKETNSIHNKGVEVKI